MEQTREMEEKGNKWKFWQKGLRIGGRHRSPISTASNYSSFHSPGNIHCLLIHWSEASSACPCWPGKPLSGASHLCHQRASWTCSAWLRPQLQQFGFMGKALRRMNTWILAQLPCELGRSLQKLRLSFPISNMGFLSEPSQQSDLSSIFPGGPFYTRVSPHPGAPTPAHPRHTNLILWLPVTQLRWAGSLKRIQLNTKDGQLGG